MYKRQGLDHAALIKLRARLAAPEQLAADLRVDVIATRDALKARICLLYTSDAADERSSVDLGGRRIIKKQQKQQQHNSERIKTHASSRILDVH